jgi:hypothetical protein
MQRHTGSMADETSPKDLQKHKCGTESVERSDVHHANLIITSAEVLRFGHQPRGLLRKFVRKKHYSLYLEHRNQGLQPTPNLVCQKLRTSAVQRTEVKRPAGKHSYAQQLDCQPRPPLHLAQPRGWVAASAIADRTLEPDVAADNDVTPKHGA